MFKNIKPRITEPEVGEIISYAAFDSSPENAAKIARKYLANENLHFYGWVEGDRVLGICGFETRRDKVEIHLLSVAANAREQGIGGKMIAALQEMHKLPIEAETDDDAVGFYRKRGFATTEFSHPLQGKRHRCVLEAKT